MDESTIPLATAAAAFATALTVIMAVRSFFKAREFAREEAAREAAELEEDMSLGQGDGKYGVLARMLRPTTGEELSMLRRRLARAGMRSQEALDLFNVARAVSLMVGVLLFFVVLVGLGSGALILGAFVLGGAFFGPALWLRSKTDTRQDAIKMSVPPTLDLLVTCMEAGLGLEQAMERVGQEITASDPELAEEMLVVVGEMKAGLTIASAFKKMADRVPSDEMKNLTNVIIQSSTLGASLGRTLREYAASARRRRELQLEEIAGKITAGLTLPLTLCLLPSAVIAMLGPAVVIVINSLFE